MSGRRAKLVRRAAARAAAQAASDIVATAARQVRRADLLRTPPWLLRWPFRLLAWLVLRPDPSPSSRAPETDDPA